MKGIREGVMVSFFLTTIPNQLNYPPKFKHITSFITLEASFVVSMASYMTLLFKEETKPLRGIFLHLALPFVIFFLKNLSNHISVSALFCSDLIHLGP
jgi:SRSO17 transposase